MVNKDNSPYKLAGYLSRLERRANNANVVGSTPTLAINIFLST